MNKNWRFWATLVLGIAVLFGTSGRSFASGAEEAANAALAFEKLKTLVGR